MRLQSFREPINTPKDAEGRSLVNRAADITARRWLIATAEAEYDAGNLEGAATLMHAEYYLTDRLAYELYPAPKNAIKLPLEDL